MQWEINGSKGSLCVRHGAAERAAGLPRRRRPRARCSRPCSSPRPTIPSWSYWWPPGHIVGWGDTFLHEVAHLLGAIGGDHEVGPYGATFEDGYRASEVCDALHPLERIRATRGDRLPQPARRLSGAARARPEPAQRRWRSAQVVCRGRRSDRGSVRNEGDIPVTRRPVLPEWSGEKLIYVSPRATLNKLGYRSLSERGDVRDAEVELFAALDAACRAPGRRACGAAVRRAGLRSRRARGSRRSRASSAPTWSGSRASIPSTSTTASTTRTSSRSSSRSRWTTKARSSRCRGRSRTSSISVSTRR